MNAIREVHPHDQMFPFVLKYSVKSSIRQKTKIHMHDWYELVFVHQGYGKFFVEPDVYEMKPGDVFLIPGDLIHQAIPDSLDPYTVSVVLFNPVLVHPSSFGDSFSYLEAFENGKPCRYCAARGQITAIERLLAQMKQEWDQKQRGYRHAELSLLQLLLVRVNRLGGSMENRPPALRSESWMKEIITYIDFHLLEDLSLTHLASQALVSPAHFSRVFKKMTGLHLPAYLSMKRLQLAKEMLARTDLPIGIVSERCHFQSTSHFHKLFKKQIGCTPGDFRKRYGDG